MKRSFLSVCLCLVLSVHVVAQEGNQPAQFEATRLPADAPDRLELNDFRHLISGDTRAPTGDRRKVVTEKMARWLLHRLTWPEIQEGREPGLSISVLMEGDGTNSKTRRGTNDWNGIFHAIDIPREARSPQETERVRKTHEYMSELRVVMTPILQELLKNKILVRVNAVRVMHRFAEAGHEEIAEEALKVLENPNEHDAVRHWAIRTLGETFRQQQLDPLFTNEDLRIKEREKREERLAITQKGAMAIYRWLETHCAISQEDLSKFASNEELDALRFIRRAAIRALAELRLPAISETKVTNPGALETTWNRDGPVAAMFVRIMNNQNMSPEAAWWERVEATYGLLGIRPNVSQTYQPDYAAHQVGAFIADLAARRPDFEDLQEFAVSLRAASESHAQMHADANSPLKGYFERLHRQTLDALINLFDPTAETNGPAELRNWLRPNQPPTGKSLFDPPLP